MRHGTEHATERALERYGVDASLADWQRAVADIMDVVAGTGCAAMLLRRYANAEHWIVRVNGEAMIAVYSPASAVILTVLRQNRRSVVALSAG